MRAHRSAVAALWALSAAIVMAGSTIVGSGQAGQLPLEPLGNKGEALFPYLEGWFTNADGTSTFLLGYYNRNSKQSFDIPPGPNNKVEPGAVDQGQPTHFLPGRENRVFTITVPKDFGNKRMTWTVVANGISQAVTFSLEPDYFVEPLIATGTGNTPPVIKVDDGPEHAGPGRGIAKTYTATVGTPVTLSVWATDKGNTIVLDPQRGRGGRGGRGGAGTDAPAPARGAAGADAAPGAGTDAARGRGGRGRGGAAADAAGRAGRGGGAADGGGGRGGRGGGRPAAITVAWSKYRGVGGVKFDPERIPLAEATGSTATTNVTFAQPGEYWLRAFVTEGAGEGGSGQCCSTSALVRVNVK